MIIHAPSSGILGSPSWVRTNDLRINSPSLYRLSYRGIKDLNYMVTCKKKARVSFEYLLINLILIKLIIYKFIKIN